MPVRQRKAITRGDFAEHEFKVGNLFVYVLITHLMYPQKWPGKEAPRGAFEPDSWADEYATSAQIRGLSSYAQQIAFPLRIAGMDASFSRRANRLRFAAGVGGRCR
jgi:hypothetical protein